MMLTSFKDVVCWESEGTGGEVWSARKPILCRHVPAFFVENYPDRILHNVLGRWCSRGYNGLCIFVLCLCARYV